MIFPKTNVSVKTIEDKFIYLSSKTNSIGKNFITVNFITVNSTVFFFYLLPVSLKLVCYDVFTQ